MKNYPKATRWFYLTFFLFIIAGSVLRFQAWQRIGGVFVYITFVFLIISLAVFFRERAANKKKKPVSQG